MDDRARRIKPWRLPPHTAYVFKNANVVDTESGVIRANCTVVVSSGFINQVVEGPLIGISCPQDAIIVDLEGRFLCPGLIDAHVHLMAVPGFEELSKAFGNPFAVSAFRQPYVCQQMLSRGFTSVRDCGGATYALKEAIEDGVFPGPRLFLSVHALSQTGGHADIRVSATGASEVRTVTDSGRVLMIMQNVVGGRMEILVASAMVLKTVSKLHESRFELERTSSRLWREAEFQHRRTNWRMFNLPLKRFEQSQLWQATLILWCVTYLSR
jgi:imidazolonepropionase-like amidohydrolase